VWLAVVHLLWMRCAVNEPVRDAARCSGNACTRFQLMLLMHEQVRLQQQ
jgi:hypothetical protein